MIGYTYRRPLSLPPSSYDSPEFIVTTSINNLMQNQCTASIIKSEYLFEFFSKDEVVNPDRDVTYTEADIYKQISTALIQYILDNKQKRSLAEELRASGFSIDSNSRTIFYSTPIAKFEDKIKEIAKKENFEAIDKRKL